MDNHHLHNEPADPSQPRDNTPIPEHAPATAADNWNPWFTPGSIVVHYNVDSWRLLVLLVQLVWQCRWDVFPELCLDEWV